MKKCPYCGKEYPDEATVCQLDANPLAAAKGTNAAPPFPNAMSGLDRLFAQSPGITFWGADARLLWGVIGVFACRHPTARKNAWIYFGRQIGGLLLAFIIILLVKHFWGK